MVPDDNCLIALFVSFPIHVINLLKWNGTPGMIECTSSKEVEKFSGASMRSHNLFCQRKNRRSALLWLVVVRMWSVRSYSAMEACFPILPNITRNILTQCLHAPNYCQSIIMNFDWPKSCPQLTKTYLKFYSHLGRIYWSGTVLWNH